MADNGEVKTESNRTVIFSKDYKYFGASMLKHPKKGYKICVHYCQNDHPATLLDGHNFIPVYKSIEKTKAEIVKSMDAERNHVRALRKKFDDFVAKEVQK